VGLASGARLGPYTIVSAIGAGGMGEVYEARDTRLDRLVAIKILPSAIADSPDAHQRFAREARAISQLAHPHICALFDVGEYSNPESLNPTPYLVLELLHGETLAQRLARGPLPIDQTLRCARQIASALDRAHRAGIVHRDLKPANVMLTTAGVKLLDFGLAKAVAPMTSATPSIATVAAAPPLTAQGIAGTVQYMAPEQLEGRPADVRSDVYALGAVIYEMATGARASTQPRRTVEPPALDQLVRTCLATDPDERWQSAHDVALQLTAISDRDATGAHPASRARIAWLPWAVAAASLAVAGVAGWRALGPRSDAPSAIVRFKVAPPAGTTFYQSAENTGLSVSPDGSQVAFSAGASGPTRIWLRAAGELEATPIAGTDGATSHFWSPDGRSIAFFAGGKLRRIDLPGGAPVSICDVREGIGFAGTWGADDQILFASIEGEAILRVSASGGVPAPFITPDRSRNDARVNWPFFLPGGRRLLYLRRVRDGSGHLMRADPGAAPREVMPMQSSVQYVDPGILLFARESALVGQRFDLDRGAAVGPPFSVAQPLSYSFTTTVARFAASAKTLVYQTAINEMSLTWFDRSGRATGTLGERGEYQQLRFSPDGRQVVFSRSRNGATDVWQADVDRGIESRLTFGASSEGAGPFTPDGRSLFFNADIGAPPAIFRKDLTTGTETPAIPASGTYQESEDVSPDGRTLLYAQRGVGGNDIWMAPIDGSRPPAVAIQTPFDETGARFSPDGRYFAFTSTQSGRAEIYVSPFPPTGERVRVSTAGGSTAVWSRDGRELLYQSENRLVAVSIQTTPSLRVGASAVLFVHPSGRPWYGFDIAPDGRLLAIEQQSRARDQPVTVVLNWMTGLRN
jgi:eukaryotic-like serine/threonine-protein kinase